MKMIFVFIFLLLFASAVCMAETQIPTIKITGNWTVSVEGTFNVTGETVSIPKQTVKIARPTTITVTNEKYENFGVFEPDRPFFAQGVPIKRVHNGETGMRLSLIPDSLVVKADPEGKVIYKLGKDYGLGAEWGFFGRLANQKTEVDRSQGTAMLDETLIKKEESDLDTGVSAIKEGSTVYVDYKYILWRIDTIATDRNGKLFYFRGKPEIQMPKPPAVAKSYIPICNVFTRQFSEKVTEDMLYPISATKLMPKKTKEPTIKTQLPRTYSKLTDKKEITILFWGDSVTCGGSVSDVKKYVWQNVAARGIQAKYPNAKIRFETTAWGGRGVGDFFSTPKGEQYNFQEHVLDLNPDLVIMEFVNDTYQFITPQMLKANYDKVKDIFAEKGIDWIILLPHFTDFDRESFGTEKYTADQRWYDKWVREEYANKYPNIAVADSSVLWGHLLYEGIPFCTLNKNGINHPNDEGHQILADSVINIF